MHRRLAVFVMLSPLGGCFSIHFPTQAEIDAMPMPNVDMRVQQSGVDTSLRGVYALSETLCFASGSNGTCLRTTDGKTWQRLPVPNADEIDFRDVHAFDADNILLMTAGTPARIYRTSDGGAHWTIVHEDHREGAFFDAMDFWDDRRGVLFGDPIDGVFTILLTDNGGRTWRHADPAHIPPALEGEAGFAASGTCVAVGIGGNAIIGLGGETGRETARALYSKDFGRSWNAAASKLRTSESAGIFSVAFFDGPNAVAVGGDYLAPDTLPRGYPAKPASVCFSDDAGKTWHSVHGRDAPLYRSSVAASWLDGERLLLAAGYQTCYLSSHLATGFLWKWMDPITTHNDASGGDWTPWRQHAADFAPHASRGWIVGAEGIITRIDLTLPAGTDTK